MCCHRHLKLGNPERMNESKLSLMSKVSTSHGPTAFPGLKVLLMDENGVSRMVTLGLLVHLGCDVTMVSSSDEFLHVVSHERNLVLMDVCVPGTSNYEIVIRILGKFTKRHERPLIAGNTDKVTKEKCMRVGMDGVILKPVSLDKMRSVLSDLLEQQVLFENDK
ncbi:hypothetical protein PTKIN_Ptkin14bG0210600 [Pterospermum kingtungense]